MNKIVLPNGADYRIKKDKFQKSRGRPKILHIKCSKCHSLVLIYQKDGPGPLLRCYLDRIAWPTSFSLLNTPSVSIKDLQPIKCTECASLLGSPFIYLKENRLAYNMKQGTFEKEIIKLSS